MLNAEPLAAESCVGALTMADGNKARSTVAVQGMTKKNKDEKPLSSIPNTNSTSLSSSSPSSSGVQKKRRYKPQGFPKKPITAYNIFFKETRQKLLREIGQEHDGEYRLTSNMVKHIASKWKTIDDETRARVDRIAQEDLERYEEQVRAYERDTTGVSSTTFGRTNEKSYSSSSSSLSIAQNSKKRRKYTPQGFPKRPLTAYNIFFMETRQKLLPENGSHEGHEYDGEEQRLTSTMVKQIASMWKTIDDETRERVDKMAKEDLERYQNEVQAYEERLLVTQNKKQQGEKWRRKEREGLEESPILDDSSGSNRYRGGWYCSDYADDTRGKLLTEEKTQRFRTSFLGNQSERRNADEDDIEVLLQDEMHALEVAANFKARQLSLAQKVLASNPQSQVMGLLENERAALGLSPLLPRETMAYQRHERELSGKLASIERKQVFPGLGSNYLGWGNDPFLVQDIGLPQDCMVSTLPAVSRHPPELSRVLDQEEMMGVRQKRLRESEHMKLELYSMRQNAMFSELAAKRQKLLTDERKVAKMIGQMRDASYGPPPSAFIFK